MNTTSAQEGKSERVENREEINSHIYTQKGNYISII